MYCSKHACMPYETERPRQFVHCISVVLDLLRRLVYPSCTQWTRCPSSVSHHPPMQTWEHRRRTDSTRPQSQIEHVKGPKHNNERIDHPEHAPGEQLSINWSHNISLDLPHSIHSSLQTNRPWKTIQPARLHHDLGEVSYSQSVTCRGHLRLNQQS